MALKPAFSVKVEGLKELEKALNELPKATGKNVLKRTSIKSLTPMIEEARSLVPIRSGRLRDSLKISTRLSKRQAGIARRRTDKSYFEIYAGASSLPHAHLVEFGTVKMRAQPFMRPAWDLNNRLALEIFSVESWKEIDAAAARIARKTARFARVR